MNIKKSGILKELTCLQCNSVLEVGPEDIETSESDILLVPGMCAPSAVYITAWTAGSLGAGIL